MTTRGGSVHPVVKARHAMRRRMGLEGPRAGDEGGFTLIELIVTVMILPLVVGGITVALLSVLNLQLGTQNRIGDSNDEQVTAATFNKDVQSAQEIETSSTPACGAAGQTQLLGLQWGADASGTYHTVVSYITRTNANANGTTTTSLMRQLCTSGASTTPTSTTTVSRDVGTPTLTFNPSTFNPSTFTGTTAPWESTQGLYGVTINITAPGSQYTYKLSGLPSASTSTGSTSQLETTQNPAGCNFANAGTGTYSNVLCFANFSSFNPSGQNMSTCQNMKLAISDSPDFLQFCVIATPASSVQPYVIPTYYSPSGDDSEAYLGNNGFYTGIPGDPALYQNTGGNTVVTFTNIQVTNAVGQPATGWTLVTGDAESTDTNEWMNFTTNLTWSILPNSSTSLYGNSCYDDANTNYNNSGLLKWTGATPPTSALVGTPSSGPPATSTALSIGAAPGYATNASSILCESDQQLNKTGTLMVASPEPSGSSAAQTLTVTMQGGGLEALFVGVLL